MADVARATPQLAPPPDDDTSITVAQPTRMRARTALDYRGMHRGTISSQARAAAAPIETNKKAPTSQLDMILQAIAQIPTMVQEQVKNTVQQEVKSVIRQEVGNIVREEVKTIVREEVKIIVREEVKNVVREEVRSIVQEEVQTIVQEQVSVVVQEQVSAIVQEQVRGIILEQVSAIVQQQLASLQLSSPSPSYADVARTPPGSHPSNIRTVSMNTTPSTMTDTLYCTVDMTGVEEAEKDKANASTIRQDIEKEMRASGDATSWRCIAVTRDPRHTARVRITCRDESELARVKAAAERTKAAGTRVLRDQLYPVKVDNANRTAVLEETGQLRPGVVEMLEKENEVKIAKISWLSRKDSTKAYGSMVVYVTKGSDAVRLLQGQYFDVAGESAYTRVFEPRRGPLQCYNCQEVGHKAYSCTKARMCGRCAQPGHRHSECEAEVPKCVPCGGPHESWSRHCRVLYPPRHA